MRLDESIFTRRDFLDGLVATGVVAVGTVAAESALGYLTGLEIPEPEKIIVGGQALETLEKQRFVLVPYGPRPVMIYRPEDGRLRALSAVCTHGQCNVRYRPKSNDIFCGCHEGKFDAEGINVPGTPPPEPLDKFHIYKQEDGTLLVSRNPLEDDAQTPVPTTQAKG